MPFGCPFVVSCRLCSLRYWRGHHYCPSLRKNHSLPVLLCSVAGAHFWIRGRCRGFCIAMRLITAGPKIRAAILCSLAALPLSQPKCACILDGKTSLESRSNLQENLSTSEPQESGLLDTSHGSPQKLAVVLWLHELHDILEVSCLYSHGQPHACYYHAIRAVCQPRSFPQ